MKNLSNLKERIETELKPIYKDIKVDVDENWQILTEKNVIHNGKHAYAGMQEAKITVSWNLFFDNLAGNGWMYANDWMFKFDAADGTCKYEGYPANVEVAVEEFIAKMKSAKMKDAEGLYLHGELKAINYSEAVKELFDLTEIPAGFCIDTDYKATGYSIVDANGVQHIYELDPVAFYDGLMKLT